MKLIETLFYSLRSVICRQWLSCILILTCTITKSLSINENTLTCDTGRIYNIDNNHIHVSASLSLNDCIRKCTDFIRDHVEYDNDDCHAYNYDTSHSTCELIHADRSLDYLIDHTTYWKTGIKYKMSN
jgi:hypothetical protein